MNTNAIIIIKKNIQKRKIQHCQNSFKIELKVRP